MTPRKPLDYLNCAVANTLEVVGDHWTLLVLRDAFMGVRRFEDFCADLGIARNILADRLRRLVEAGILETRRYEERPPRDEYVLTEKGRDLFDVLLALWRWGDRWAPAPPAHPRQLVHLTCGQPTHAIPVCVHCNEPLHRRDLRVEPSLSILAQAER